MIGTPMPVPAVNTASSTAEYVDPVMFTAEMAT
jgi:hypothetical protein